MNVFYEEESAFKVGLVLSDQAGALQIESPHGKRSKIKASQVLLSFQQPPLGEFLAQAQALAGELDVPFLWECAGSEEFAYTDLARDYLGHAPSPLEAAAMLLCLHAASRHFHKKGPGRFKAATADALRAAEQAAQRKQKQAELQAEYVQQLTAGQLPEALRKKLPGLLYRPDGNTEAKALEQAAQALRLPPARLLARVGALAGSHDFHFGRFLFEFFPHGREFPAVPPIDDFGTLPRAAVAAFSIDDSSTTEIDDAFSVTALPDGGHVVGIHIAAPALGFLPGSPIDDLARQRMSTVYVPGDKITMLPASVAEHFTLAEGRDCPALSLYLTLARDGRLLTEDTRVELVPIAKNLRYPAIDELCNEESLRLGRTDYPFAEELRVLWDLAQRLEAQRGKGDPFDRPDFSFYFEGERVRIVPRRRGAPVDKIVSELMIYVNSAWGKLLGDRDVRALFRVQDSGKVRMSLYPAAHLGLGVAQYLWSSSPLRRYADLVNQWQLLSVVEEQPLPFGDGDGKLLQVMRDFEAAHAAYDDFQRTMERYWCLRFLQQEQIQAVTATVLRENLVRFDTLPLYQRVPSLPELPAGTQVTLTLSRLDEWELTLHCDYKKQPAAT